MRVILFRMTIAAMIFFAMTCFLYQASVSRASVHYPPWIDQNMRNFNSCLNFKKKWRRPISVNQALFPIICSYVETQGKTYVHHSDYRGNMKPHSPSVSRASQHNTGAAIDFRLSTYQGLNKCQRWVVFTEDVLDFVSYLDEIAVSGKIGFGFYPNQNNPFLHIDMRGPKPNGTPSTWARIGSTYVSLDRGISWLQKQYAAKCGGSLMLAVRPEVQSLWQMRLK